MTRSPSLNKDMALKVAAMVAAENEAEDAVEVAGKPATPTESSASTALATTTPAGPSLPVKRGRGRPRNRRIVEARHTVYLDAARQDALTRIADDRGRSVHSLILEGIDHVIGKPQQPGWR